MSGASVNGKMWRPRWAVGRRRGLAGVGEVSLWGFFRMAGDPDFLMALIFTGPLCEMQRPGAV